MSVTGTGASPGDGSLTTYLRARGQLPAPRVTRLDGGVSGETFLVESAPARLVVKRALSKLLVTGDWSAKPERAMTEAAALDLLHGLTPDHTPELLDTDPATNTLVISAAPAGWVNWKEVLMGTVADPTRGIVSVATELGTVLGRWHAGTWHDDRVAAGFDDYEAFEQLRVGPFHRRVAAAHPAVAGRVEDCANELLTRRDCLVHGDFSPKNVLVGADGLMVLDFEVAHVGAAVFDVAFMSCHLALKALHLPGRAGDFAAAAEALLAAYRDTGGSRTVPEQTTTRLGWHTACLMLARVDGLSPATYLSPDTAATVRRLALRVLASADSSPGGLWRAIGHAARESVR